MREKIFLESIEELLNDNKLYHNAKLIQKFINNENRLQKAIDEIEKTTANNSLA